MGDSTITVGEGNVGSRKRKKIISRREAAKMQRLSHPGTQNINFLDLCRHKAGYYRCLEVTEQNVKILRGAIYSKSEKSYQDQWICRYISVDTVKISTKERKKKPRQLTIRYYIPDNNKKAITVCEALFLKACGFSKSRKIRIAKVLKAGKVPCELRGGDRVSKLSVYKKNKKRDFLKSLRGNESHYSRGKSTRIYLSSDLSIQKLHKIYNQQNTDSTVSLQMFNRIFVGEFNIGFSSPASDVCSQCTRLKYMIQIEKDSIKKQELITNYRVHKLRAKAFYTSAKEEVPNSISLCFDLEQVQPLPRTPISDAFYYHQIGLYALGIVQMNGKNPTFYMWSENEAARGATEVASALLHHLNHLNFDNISILRLFCDGCAGQNKNSHIIHALIYALNNMLPHFLKKIVIFFPVRGHSYLPADRVFGRVEKLLRKKPTILHKKEYFEIYESVGRVKKLGSDWVLYDIKNLQSVYKKLESISTFKRIYIEKIERKNKISIEVKGLKTYRFEREEKGVNLTKRGKSLARQNLIEIPLGHEIKQKKKVTVEKLLQAQFGKEWRENRELKWYREVLGDEVINDGQEDEEEDKQEEEEERTEVEKCDCLTDEDEIQI